MSEQEAHRIRNTNAILVIIMISMIAPSNVYGESIQTGLVSPG